MAHISKTPSARRDLGSIWDYISIESEKRAYDLMRVIERTLLLLSERPEMGRRRPEIDPEVRSFPVRNYVIFYQINVDGIEILRVLHGARDISDESGPH